MELGWWPQLGLTFLQLLLISSLPRGTVSSIQDPPGGDFSLRGLVGGRAGASQEVVLVWMWVGVGGRAASSDNLGGLAGDAGVSVSP